MTYYHSKYYANYLTLKNPNTSLERFWTSLINAKIDLNPHQVDGALFFFKNPLSDGVILADEVWLWKTIEAWLVICQLWSEYKRKILLIVPASLRKQWSAELEEKFFVPSIIMDNDSYKKEIKNWNFNPLNQNKVVIASYEFVAKYWQQVNSIDWNLVIMDEAHKLRNVYKKSNKSAKLIKSSIKPFKKILLTATPLQNSLLELYWLVSFIDEHVFGDINSFKRQFIHASEVELKELKQRMKKILHRTLRKHVLEYIKYTNRIPITQKFTPSDKEQELYNKLSEFLQRESLKSINNSHKHLIILVLRKLLASSTKAISQTLDNMITRLESQNSFLKIFDDEDLIDEIDEDLEDIGEDMDKNNIEQDLKEIKKELEELKYFSSLAKEIKIDEKTKALKTVLKTAFKKLEELWANKKWIIFTESRKTQDYLKKYLEEDLWLKVVLFNGTNNSPESKQIYKEWLKKYEWTSKITWSKTSDMRAALVEYFEKEADIMIATESASEWVNLQFCSLLINYDLPWNPQRIEQRIWRVHRYWQKFDVLIVNFINTRNQADIRVYELLNQKFKLFNGVFGASDEILGTVDGGDFEKRILEIYQKCRTDEEINREFDLLQQEMDEKIKASMNKAKEKIFKEFDEQVILRLKNIEKEWELKLDKYRRCFWNLTKIELKNKAIFNEDKLEFKLIDSNDGKVQKWTYTFDKDSIDKALFYRTNSYLWEKLINQAKSRKLPINEIIFDTSKSKIKYSAVENLKWKSGYVRLDKFTINTFDKEEYLIFTWIDDEWNKIEQEIFEKMFLISGIEKEIIINKEVNQKLEKLKEENIKQFQETSTKNNYDYFQQEIEKLEAWESDMKFNLKQELEELKQEYNEKKKEAMMVWVKDIQKKIELEKEAMKLNKKYNEKQKVYWDEIDKIEKEKWRLIGNLQQKMNAGSEEENLFIVKWKVI
jgi:superfamily II DNA or RNA helicase